MHQKRPIFPLLLLFLFLLWGSPTPALQAQTFTPTINRNEAVINFPNDVTFHLEVDPATPIVTAELAYDVPQFSCLESAAHVPVEVNGSRLEWQWVMIRSGNPPPGTQLWWEWRLTDANGNTYTTPRQTAQLEDGRFDWRAVQAEGITLNWYEGDEVGPMLLESAVAGLDRLENDMGIQLSSEVQFFIYGNATEMRDAVLYIQDWAGGVAFSEYNTILMGVEPGIAASWGVPTVRHELAHLVIGQFGRSCLGGRRPTWLEEGLAVYAEGTPQTYVLQDIETGIQNNSFQPLRSLNGAFPAHGEAAGIAYSQSYSTVVFLLETYGQEKMSGLLLALAEGATYDEALQQVYGFNVDGLELAWREHLGLAARQIPPTPTPILAANIPTIVPFGVPNNVPTPESAAATAVPLAAAEPATTPGPCTLGLILPLLLVFSAYRPHKRHRGANHE